MKTIRKVTLPLLIFLNAGISSSYSQSFSWSNDQVTGTSNEICNDVCTDASGNIYVVGNTSSANFLTTPGSFQTVSGGGTNDIFLQKYNSSGTLLWSTYYGGSGDDTGTQITTDANGDVYVTGSTNSINFPVTVGAFQVAVAGGYDAYVIKFDGAGSRLWATYYGGASNDFGQGIEINSTGKVFITGTTFSTIFPTTAGAYQLALAGASDVFVASLNNSGTQLWSSYLGGTSTDASNGIAIDLSNDDIYLVGKSLSTNFPVTVQSGAYSQATNAGGTDGFISKFNSTGSLLWSSYFGGSNLDIPGSISCDNNGNVWVAGYTASTDMPTRNPGSAYFQAANAGGSTDVMLLKFDNSDSLTWSTYYGGTGAEYGMAISAGNDSIYVTGTTGSTNFPTTNPGGGAFFQGTNGGGSSDGFILRLNSSATTLWATYFGGTGNESGNGITTNAADVTYLTGAFDNTLTLASSMTTSGGSDGYLGKIFNCSGLSLNIQTTQAISCSGGNNGALSANATGGTAAYLYMWSTAQIGATIGGLSAGTYSCSVTDANGCTDTASINLVQPNVLSLNNSSDSASCGGTNGAAYVMPLGGTSPYMYLWSTGATMDNITGVAAGVYSVSVTDVSGCTIIGQVGVADSCGNYSPVWPGDCNYDLKADFVDFLNIGVAFGQTGAVRPFASNAWVAQPAPNWSTNFPVVLGGNDYKHGDCNGDGVVDLSDTTAIISNYGLTHLKKSNTAEHILTNPDLYLTVNIDTAAQNQIVTFDINLGTTSLPIDSIYGIAYKINYDQSLTKQKPTINYTTSWLGTPGTDLISFEKSFHASGFTDLVITRSNQQNRAGSGKIGTCGIVTTDNLSGFSLLSITISDIKAITYSGTTINLNGVGDSIVINPNVFASIKTEDLERTISVYPNPAKNNFSISSPMAEVSGIRIINLLGETILNISDPGINPVDVSSMAEGVYTLGIKVNNSWIYQKLLVSH